jgi:VIT1/CCC1 family predicted Fe2+/Mn2+ transporter
MERGEGKAGSAYARLVRRFPELEKLHRDENRHERALIGMLEEKLLDHVGSIVLGLNDALVEFTGALAGFTFALGSTRTVALAGAITGVAAALSMASAEYMSQRSEGEAARALRAAFYTGMAYIVTVALLVLPYTLLSNGPLCLAIVIITALTVIFVFNYYLSVAKDLPFWRRFGEMAVISLSVATVSFLIGLALRVFFGIAA